MAFDEKAFKDMVENYLINCVELEIVDYIGVKNPIGSASLGVNIDVGETNSFDLRITNNGPLGLRNIVVRISSRRGKVTQSFSGLVDASGSHWTGPFLTSTDVRPFDLDPHQTHLLQHEVSGGPLFGYNAEETTGGADNARDVETLLSATIIKWDPYLKMVLGTVNSPTATFESFIQRS